MISELSDVIGAANSKPDESHLAAAERDGDRVLAVPHAGEISGQR